MLVGVCSKQPRYGISTLERGRRTGSGSTKIAQLRRERQSREGWWRVQRFYDIIVGRGGGGGPLVDEADERPSGVRR